MKLAAEKKKFKFKATQLSSSSSPIAARVFTAAGNSGRPDATAEPQSAAVERPSDKACGKPKALLDDRTRQLLVQLTLKDKRCPPLPCNSKDLLHQVTKAKFDCEDPSYSEEKEVDARRVKAASAFRTKLVHAKKRSGFIGSNGRRPDMTTTSGIAGRRRMPGDSISGTDSREVACAHYPAMRSKRNFRMSLTKAK